MRKSLRKLFVGSTVLALTLSTLFAPTASAASSFATETNVKKALYALAAYDCISNKLVLQDTAIGNKMDSIAAQAEYTKTYVGAWLGDEDGNITCKTALTKTFGSGNITEGMLNSGKLLEGVYEKDSSAEQKIRCNYGIVNSSANATQSGTYSWPQGYYYDGNGDLVDKRSHGVIEVVFNEDGPIRLEGATSDIDATHTLESMKNISINWSKVNKICQPLVMYTEVYSYPAVNALGESITFYDSILATTDGTPFGEWGIHVDDSYHAWVHSNSDKFTHTLSTVSTSTALKLTSDAKTKLLSNLATLYLDGKTSAVDFLNSHADAKYILYGRYLFNGDGNGGFACGGISVATDDPNFSNLNATDFWDVTQPYVAAVSAYEKGSATSKSSYRTKFGGNGLMEAGSARSVNFPGVAGDCKTLAGEFNGINPTSSTAKLQVANYMKVTPVEELPEENDPGTTGGVGGTENTGGSDIGACFGQASSLGWIICPVVQLLGDAVDGVYEGIENQFLYVNPDLISSGGGVRMGWGYFRNFTNIVFVILLAIIIISQVTGLFVSNYGIKKMLPTLIIVAVLVNISFFICQFAVDVSNIVGYSLKEMLQSLPGNQGNLYSFGSILNGIVGTLLTGAAVGVAGAVAIAAWPAWILPLLLVLLTTIISILFFYLLLAVRQAGIIILVVVSPLAIVCYALPNTKKVFSRWWQMFSSLLILFPICGALIGGGMFASSLLLGVAGGSFFFYLVAVLLQVVPFFFIPSLLRSSMSALGNLGVKMANMGNRLGRSLNRGIVGTDTYRDAQRRNEMRNAERTFNRIDKGKDIRSRLARGMRRLGATSQAQGLEASAQRRRARAISKYDSSAIEDLKARVGQTPMTEGSRRYDAMLDRLEADQLDDMAKSYISQYKKSGQADSEEIMETEYQNSLSALMENPEDRELKAQLLAAQRILAKSDTGRGRMQNSLYGATANGGEGNAGHRFAHSALLDEYGADIKAKSPGFHSYLATVASGGALEGDFTTDNPTDANPYYRASAYDGAKIGSLEGNRLAGMDEVALDRMLDSARNNLSSWSADDIEDFNMASRDALSNSNINTQRKIGRKINDIRRALGLTSINTRADGQDSGTIDLRGNNGGANNRGANGGPTVRTGNDDRGAQGRANGPLPSPLRDADNWRQNDDHGGIILPPGVQ